MDVPELDAISRPTWALWDDLRRAQAGDAFCGEMRGKMECKDADVDEYDDHDGLLLCRGRVYVPSTGPLKETIIKHVHDSMFGGHSGVYRTWMRQANTFYWPGQQGEVQEYVARCDECQRVKADSRRPGGLLQPLPVPERIWEDITMDFIEGLPMSNGFIGLMVVVDRLTKYAHFIPLTHTYTAKSITRLFVEYMMKLHVGSSFDCDRDRIFLSSFWSV
ncbi:polyprotein [Striga asiatica]|uniref:Polyprotein n=1 Tax=Striga asiatica TaxID=4170 RepID=A0A5A7QLT0_STRAF|nr:polyprotein [Striga asiatica]